MRNDLKYSNHRVGAWDVLDDKYSSRKAKLPPEEYFDYLYHSKVCLSPFGMGEVCFRDFDITKVNKITTPTDYLTLQDGRQVLVLNQSLYNF